MYSAFAALNGITQVCLLAYFGGRKAFTFKRPT